MIILNEGQQKVSDAAVDWYWNSSDTLFQFDGKAGTGKSVVLNDIVSRLMLKPENVLPMAYTGQAAIVMRTKGMMGACTCHSGLFEPVEEPLIDNVTGKVVMDEQFNVPITTMRFIPKSFFNTNIKLMIIDEAWTVPKSFRKVIENTGIKTIVAGDSGQLPPVADEPAYLVDGKIYHLDQLMRQNADSPLIYLANRAREGKPIEIGQYGYTTVIYDDEVNDMMLSFANIVLCGKNKTRDYVNKYSRHNIYGFDTDYPMYGERLICRKNNWKKDVDGISLANGLVGTVSRPPSIDNYNDKLLVLDFKPDLLDNSFINLKINYDYLNAPYGPLKDQIKNSKFAKGEMMEYAYASTVHLSQGSEYRFGVYFEEFLSPTIQSNLNYTAITRFKSSMVYVKRRPRYGYFK